MDILGHIGRRNIILKKDESLHNIQFPFLVSRQAMEYKRIGPQGVHCIFTILFKLVICENMFKDGCILSFTISKLQPYLTRRCFIGP